jgi:ABC-type Fe3+ transport system substrate-binding protein
MNLGRIDSLFVSARAPLRFEFEPQGHDKTMKQILALMYPLTLARHAPHPYSAALFYDFLISEEGQRLIAKEGRVVAHPKVEPIYPRMKELQGFLGTSRVQLNTLEQNHQYYRAGLQLLDEIVLKRKSSGL